MAEKVEINDPVDWAIIQSFYRAEKHILMLKKIVSIVRESSDKKDKTIEARIGKLVDKNYLVKKIEAIEGNHDTGSSEVKRRPGLYGLNESLEFEYTGVPLTLIEVPADIRRSHTNELKGAIKDWIKHFPEPTYSSLGKEAYIDLSKDNDKYMDPLRLNPYVSDIAYCEQHLLFSDLGNHLPNVGCDVFPKWEKYKRDLTELNEMHRAFLAAITTEVEEWLHLFMPFYIHEIPRSDTIPRDIASIICPLLLRFISLDKLINETFLSNPIPCLTGRKTSTDLKKMLDIIKSPNRDRLDERKDLAPFTGIVERILQKKEIMKSANEFAAKIRDIEIERSTMMRDLENALFYTSYPGECRYLS